MRLSVLFLFHKDVEVCANRLEIVRAFNSDVAIYGLYGGEAESAAEYRKGLDSYLDDFFVFPGDRCSRWKWWHMDQLIAEWYRARGKDLTWETIVLVPWDMVVVGALGTLFSDLMPDEILLSGLRPVREIERWWPYVSKQNPERRAQYLAFLERVRNEHSYDHEPLACLMALACLPRSFLDRYAQISEPELGYLEYKIPIFAQIYGTPFCTSHPFRPWWDRPIIPWYPPRRWNRRPPRWTVPPTERALNAGIREIPHREIRRQLRAPLGARIFHPVYGMYAPNSLEELSR